MTSSYKFVANATFNQSEGTQNRSGVVNRVQVIQNIGEPNKIIFKNGTGKDISICIEKDYDAGNDQSPDFFKIQSNQLQNWKRFQKEPLTCFIQEGGVFVYAVLVFSCRSYIYAGQGKLMELNSNRPILDNFSKASREGYIILSAYGTDAIVNLFGFVDQQVTIRRNTYEIFSRPKGSFFLEITQNREVRRYLVTTGRSYYVNNSSVLIDRDNNIVIPLYGEDQRSTILYGDYRLNDEIKKLYGQFPSIVNWKNSYVSYIGSGFVYEYIPIMIRLFILFINFNYKLN